jgi:hypothetical protein
VHSNRSEFSFDKLLKHPKHERSATTVNFLHNSDILLSELPAASVNSFYKDLLSRCTPFLLSFFLGGSISTKGATGNKWWNDLAKCGDDTSVKLHTVHSHGKSQYLDLQRGQIYPPGRISLWHVHKAYKLSERRCGNPILII